MAGALAKIGQSSGVDKGKNLMEGSQQLRKSPRHKQQEEEWMKFHEEVIRISNFPEYVDPRLEGDEPIVIPPVIAYELPVLELPPDFKVTGHLLGCRRTVTPKC